MNPDRYFTDDRPLNRLSVSQDGAPGFHPGDQVDLTIWRHAVRVVAGAHHTWRDHFVGTRTPGRPGGAVRTGRDALALRLQGSHLSSSLVASPIASDVRRLFDANTAFFRLMQGFLALGLLVGVTGLGVVMVRAVRERRRTIGILRALGFQARTIQRSFLWESVFVAVEGIVLGSVLGVLTTWLMYQKSSAFSGLEAGFPIEGGSIALLGAATFAASLPATVGPARRADGIRPALAVRIAD